MKIKIFTCGGTIDKVYFDAKSEFQVGKPQIATVLEESNVTVDYDIESIMKKDSLDMSDEDRATVRAKVEAAAEQNILMTHGTDTMIQTARALVGIPDKTIVLTGSLAPARFRVSDAIFNIGSAITAAQTLAAGVYIAMNGRVFDPNTAVKNTDQHRFEDTGE